MEAFGKKLARQVSSGGMIAFFGDLGTGKTTLAKALISSLTGLDPREISSPTFTYLHFYEDLLPIYHFDLYRLKNEEEFLEKGFLDYLSEEKGVILIEWAERIQKLLPPHAIKIAIKYTGENEREIEFCQSCIS